MNRTAGKQSRTVRSEQTWRVVLAQNMKAARTGLGTTVASRTKVWLETLTREFGFSVKSGDLQIINSNWYVTHTGLLALARRKKCRGIHVEAVESLCDSATNRFVLKATAFPSKNSTGFVGYGDADPSNVSPLVRGAEMRVAETRAVNRALRKAYGIGICSVDEIGSFAEPISAPSSLVSKKLPPQPVNGNGNYGGPKVRDRLCQLIRQHHLDASLVKAYAVDFCGTQTLREASREQVESFVTHLAEWAEKDRNALLCQLNSYLPVKERKETAGTSGEGSAA